MVMRYAIKASAMILTAALLAPAAFAKPLSRKDVPQPLVPWVDWVLAGHEQEQCPFSQGIAGSRTCVWPATLRLELGARGGTFTQRLKVHAESWAALPGDAKRWPQDVLVDGVKAPVVGRGSIPHLLLKSGDHTVTGSFVWDTLPELLQVPPETGLLSLTVRGQFVLFPVRDPNGRLWLQKIQKAGEEKSRLEVVVHRRVVDDIPLNLVTQIQLKVSGKNREVVLGRALPKGFEPMALNGPLPVRIEPDGRLRVQVRAGNWNISLAARHEGPVEKILLEEPDGPWDAAEVWVFESQNALRLVTVEGVPAIDPQQTELPGDWRNFPAYLMKPGDTMKLTERRRGDADPAPDRLSLDRALWLDFDGGGLTVQDAISGDLHRSWRLEMQPRTELGRAAVGGQDQFITSLEKGGAAGIEIRQGSVSLSADSRIEGGVSNIPAVSWRHDFDKVKGSLYLPPGWRLIHARGVDKASPTWITQWSLMDMFLVLIIGLSVGKLWGPRWGATALAALALSWHEPGAPRWVWLLALAPEALNRALPEGKIRKAMRAARAAAWVSLVLVALAFLIVQVRQAIYVQLESASGGGGFAPYGSLSAEMAAAPGRAEGNEMAKKSKGVGGGGGFRGGAIQAMSAEVDMAEDMAPQALPVAPEMKREQRQMRRMGYGSSMIRQDYAPDPKSQVNTGPGLPNWTWRHVSLTWQGPVKSGAELKLWLISPGLRLVLTLLRVALITLLTLLVLGLPLEDWRRALSNRAGWRKAAAWFFPALLLFLGAALPARAGAPAFKDHPPKELLDELRSRLLEKPECAPNCASSPRLILEAAGGSLSVRLEVNALAETAVPLPGGSQQWVPANVTLDGASARGLTRSNDGVLWLNVPSGAHQVLLSGPLPDQETVQVPLPLKPHRVAAKVSDWILDGLHEDGLADDTLQLTRIRGAKDKSKRTLEPGTLPPFVSVERTLTLGLSWRVTTVVTRLSPSGTPILVEVPLIAGESVTTDGMRVEKGKAVVNLSPRAGRAQWSSTLAESRTITLTAPDSVPWVERWTLNASPIWHVVFKGIPTVHASTGSGPRVRVWRPWPGETVTVGVSRPEGVPGQTLTIDHAELTLRPGLRASDASLSLSLRSSRGGQHTVTLPEGADLQTVLIDGGEQPIRQEARKVTLPIRPGSHVARFDWRQEGGIGISYKTPEVDAGANGVNAEIKLHMPGGRWTLFACGPRLGPAVLFWSLLAVFFLVSVGLGRVDLTPLRWRHWFLLSLGLTQAPIPVAGFVAVWLVTLGWRKAHPREGRRAFNAVQALVVVMTFAALGCLSGSIAKGLLGMPDMQISGNGSSGSFLQWYQDRSGSGLPGARVFSVPLIVYRAAMLAWALWLATSLLEWLKWGWSCFNEGGLWKAKEAKPEAAEKPQAP